MTTKTRDAHIEITLGVAGGKPRLAGRRITATEHDLSIYDIYAALAYYFDHRSEVDSGQEAI